MMRGAGLRLDNDVRRLWHCDACGTDRKVGAQVTTVRCQCAGRPAMKLVEAKRRERPLKEPTSPYLEFVFEPGELAPSRAQLEEEQARLGNSSSDPNSPAVNDRDGQNADPAAEGAEPPLDAETRAAMEREVNEGGLAPPLNANGPRPAQGSRPPRRNDRRNDRGPANGPPPGRTDNRPRQERPGPDRPRSEQPPRNQPPRQEPRRPDERRPAASDGPPPSGDTAPRRDRPRRRRKGPPNDQPANLPPPPESGGFGEGIPVVRPPEP